MGRGWSNGARRTRFASTARGLACLAAACSLTAQAANVTLDWTVDWVEDVNPDGLQTRRAIGVNGQYPPPIININSTDSLTINVKNGFTDGRGTSLHSHGMYFNNTNYYDGAVSVTQCPIPPGQSITYQPVNSPASPLGAQRQWGTFWTHGHYDGQYVDGLRTPSIIHAEQEVHAYDDDYTVILADWYYREHKDLLVNEFLNVKNPTGAEPVPDSSLIYIAHTPQNGTAQYLPGYNEDVKLPFAPGKTYRLRLINMSALAMFHFWIEGHDMAVIEADGVDTAAMPVDLVTLSAAQRYSILLTARNDSSSNWLMHANMDPDMFDQVPPALQLNRTSTIVYNSTKGAAMGSNRPTVDEYAYFDDTKLVPSVVKPMVTADVSHDLVVDFTTYGNGKNYASFNGVSFVAAQTPSLLTAMTMQPSNDSDLPAVYGPNSNAFVVPHLAMTEITIINKDTGKHPFHMHGTQFQIVHKSQDSTSSDASINPPLIENQVNPMRRDTVMVPGGGSATLRFRADNPGAWFFHCHIDWHLSSGLAAVILEAPDMLASRLNVPLGFAEQCSAMNLTSSGNAGGLQSLTDFGTLSPGPPPLISGWTANAIGTFIACILTALIGLGTICWYGFSSRPSHVDDDDEEEDDTSSHTSDNGQESSLPVLGERDPESQPSEPMRVF